MWNGLSAINCVDLRWSNDFEHKFKLKIYTTQEINTKRFHFLSIAYLDISLSMFLHRNFKTIKIQFSTFQKNYKWEMNLASSNIEHWNAVNHSIFQPKYTIKKLSDRFFTCRRQKNRFHYFRPHSIDLLDRFVKRVPYKWVYLISS